MKLNTVLLVMAMLLYNLAIAQNISNEITNILAEKRSDFALTASDIKEYEITHQHVSRTSGVHHIYIRQTYEGIPVYQSVGGIHLKNEELIKMDLQFIGSLKKKIINTQPAISAAAAIQFVATEMAYPNIESPILLEEEKNIQQKQVFSKSGISLEKIPVQLMYQVLQDGTISLAWDLSILELDAQNWWSMRVDAITGKVLHKDNWTVSCDFNRPNSKDECGNTIHQHQSSCLSKNHVHHHKSVSTSRAPDSYMVYALGIESPSHGTRTLEVNPADNTASAYGWHDTDGVAGAEFTTTRGNNVWAQEDVDNDDGLGYSPDGSASLDFNYPIDFTQGPTVIDNQNSAITNLFYWNNIMHDVWYQYGFDEASGNFQENNYDNGGTGGDSVNADAQDSGGTNNANFSVPTEGSNPRMQMYLWSVSLFPLEVNSPISIAGTYDMVIASFGLTSVNLTGNLVIADDGTSEPTLGCEPFVNAAAIEGNIALIDRGICDFSVKVLNAQNAGATAVVVCNNQPNEPFSMGSGSVGESITIPSVMISQSDCAIIRTQIPTVNITMTASVTQEIDASLDNGIIAHEYGHGISIRLAGGADNSTCLSNEEQMGEGWSDWFGLMLTTNSSDAGTDIRGIGTYVREQAISGGGIRPYPYSTDTTISAYTYEDIKTFSIPHGVGSVWCSMLWEMTWKLVDQYGWDDDYYNGTGGNNMAMNIVIEALKLQPCSPGFVDGRDAILEADAILYGGANYCLIWEAFASRGLGYSASQGSSGSRSDGTESFDNPPDSYLTLEKTVDVISASPNGLITYTITATNNTSATLCNSTNSFSNVIITDELPDNTTYVSASNGGTLVGTTVTYPMVNIAQDQSHTVTLTVQVSNVLTGEFSNFMDDIEDGNKDWSAVATAPITGNWTISNANPKAGISSWFAQNYDSANDQSLITKEILVPAAGSVLTFWHNYDTELNWDGGQVHISDDNGRSWSDLGAFMTQNGYNDYIDNDSINAAFGGTSDGYIETKIDLSSFTGQYIKLRFFMHCDAAVGGVGWYIDDIMITNLETAIPNTALLMADVDTKLSASLDTPTIIITPSCSDGIMNGMETTTDCGGACAPCCVANENITGIVLTNTYQVSNQITSTGIIPSTETVSYLANSIELQGGFAVELGATFNGQIIACTPLVGSDNENALDRQTGDTVEERSNFSQNMLEDLLILISNESLKKE